MSLKGRERPMQEGKGHSFLYSHNKYLSNTCYVSGTIYCRLWAYKIHAYWTLISDMKIIQWRDIVEQLGWAVRGSGGVTLGRVVKEVVSGLRPDGSQEP